MKFQTAGKERFGQAIRINGRTYTVSLNGVINLAQHGEQAEDIRKLRGMPKEWQEVPDTTPFLMAPSLGSVAPPISVLEKPAPAAEVVFRGAKDFIAAYNTDEDLKERFDRLRSPAVKRSMAEALGFRFTDEELAAAVKEHNAAHPQPPPPAPKEPPGTPPPEPGKGTEVMQYKIPDETKGEIWPDPTTDMPVEFLRTMAERWKVKYTPRTSKRTLVSELKKVMFEDDPPQGT